MMTQASLKSTELTVDLPAMTYFNNPDSQFRILDGIDNSIISLANPITVVTRQLFSTGGPGIGG